MRPSDRVTRDPIGSGCLELFGDDASDETGG